MKRLRDFTPAQWLAGQPLVDAFKQTRNDLYLKLFCRHTPEGHAVWLAALKNHFVGEEMPDLVLSIAFEQPKVIATQIQYICDNAENSVFVVADNSRTPAARQAIQSLCAQASVAYIGLPRNAARHANRSHGMAMQWCYENIVRPLQPRCFTYIDHDLIPTKPFNFSRLLGKHPIYGVLWKNKQDNAWQLWAGYCSFNYSQTQKYQLNFLYDFSNGLDTGGRNFTRLYQHQPRNQLTFASNVIATLTNKSPTLTLQIIDDCWIHMGGAGHKTNFNNNYEYFSHILERLNELPGWSIHGQTFEQVNTINH